MRLSAARESRVVVPNGCALITGRGGGWHDERVMVSLRLIVPPDRTTVVVERLAADLRTTNVVVLTGGGIRPAGTLSNVK